MEILEIFKELLTNTKGFLELFVQNHGTWIYGLLFLIVFWFVFDKKFIISYFVFTLSTNVNDLLY